MFKDTELGMEGDTCVSQLCHRLVAWQAYSPHTSHACNSCITVTLYASQEPRNADVHVFTSKLPVISESD